MIELRTFNNSGEDIKFSIFYVVGISYSWRCAKNQNIYFLAGQSTIESKRGLNCENTSINRSKSNTGFQLIHFPLSRGNKQSSTYEIGAKAREFLLLCNLAFPRHFFKTGNLIYSCRVSMPSQFI